MFLEIDYCGTRSELQRDVDRYIARVERWQDVGPAGGNPRAVIQGPIGELRRLARDLGYTDNEVTEVAPDNWN